MKKIRQIRRLRKGWKILAAVIFTFMLGGGYMLYASASTSVNVALSAAVANVTVGTSTTSIYVNQLTGTDENHVETDPNLNYTPVPSNVEWTSSNSNIATFYTSSSDTSYAEKVYGTNPTIVGVHAGSADVTATYYTKTYDPSGAVTTSSKVSSANAKIIVPISVKVNDDYTNTPSNTVYKVGDNIVVSANTSDANKLFISTSNDTSGTVSKDGVVKLVSSSATSATLQVVGGGATTVTVRTADGDGNNSLTYTFTVRGTVSFDTTKANASGNRVYTLASGEKYMVLDKTPFTAFNFEEVPSDVIYPTTSNVIYRTADASIATVKAGTVCGASAGVTKVTAGLNAVDTKGNETWYTSDTVNIVVPFKKMGNDVTNMNVGDQIQLSTSAKASSVTWSTTDTSVLQVDATTGLATAKGAGTATIYATRTQDELYTTYGLPCQLTYTINVIDGFGLSSNSTSVNIGSSFDLEALVTSDVSTYPVTFQTENQAGSDGKVPTATLVTTSQNGKILTVTGAASGTVKITASQNVKGVVKSATCIVYVTTPVGTISINPSSLSIDRGETGTVQVLFNPAGPTNSHVLWSSSNPSVATVTGDSYTAKIQGVAGGTATITVISEDGLKVATCDVSVREPVTGVTLNATTVNSTMAIGKYQLVASVLPSGEGVNRNVTWTSSDTSVCTVDANGLVTYVKPGYATIVCKTADNSYIATCNFVISIPVDTIKLDHTSEIMSKGSSLKITAEILPITASNRAVSWESSNTSVCIVDSNGLVTSVGTGNCTILCKSLDGGCTAMCNIYVKQPVTSVVLNTTDITVRKGQVFWLNATCLPENADNKLVTWKSNDDKVCKVESDGKVTATGVGTTSVIATNTDTGLTGYCVVTVTQPITGITLNSTYQELWVGAKYAIIPTILPLDAQNKNVTYTSSDPTVATVDANGVVTAVKGGSCVIEVVTQESSLVAACTIDVKEYVSTIALSETSKYMNIGSSGKLTAKVGASTATNKAITWSSSNSGICSVDGDGNLYANSPGTAAITATAADGSGVSASCVVQVVNPVTSISVEPDTIRLLVGNSQIVRAVISPEDATIQDVTWTSSNGAVATVDESGEVVAVGVGKCKITATSNDGNAIKGVCWVYVTPVVNITSLKINSSDIYMLSGKSRHLSVIVRPLANTDSYSWYSTDTGIVAVDGDGTITTVGPGTAQVVVESGNAGVTASCTVHSLAISRSSISLEQYDSYYLDVIGTTDKITWRSSNPRVCTVTTSGQVVGRQAGTTTVTAVVDGKTLTCVVRVTNFR